MAKAKNRRNKTTTISFKQQLILNRWFLSFFDCDNFEDLKRSLDRDEWNQFDGTLNHTPYYEKLVGKIPLLSDEKFSEYDENIVRHTKAINEARIIKGEPVIIWKYFQYLALLATEIYLDRYFSDPNALIQSIKNTQAKVNQNREQSEKIDLFDEEECSEVGDNLNKLAYWIATGGGKTLLMHVHFYQYLHYWNKYPRDKKDLNHIILITPNEGLSKQHLKELENSGIPAAPFEKNTRRNLFNNTSSSTSERMIEVIEISKFKEQTRGKDSGVTVSVDSFEGNNLVFVDEGHRGTSSEAGLWLRVREQLCANGFSFEYSATFGEAISTNKELTKTYAKSILFDYSYRWFYKDGFGKDYHILNIEENVNEDFLYKYMTAGLLTYYEQLRLYEEKMKSSEKNRFLEFNIARPLWVFVGSKVNAKNSDVIKILEFIARFVKNERAESVCVIKEIVSNGVFDTQGQNIFNRNFKTLPSVNTDQKAETLFKDILENLFRSPSEGRLVLKNIKGADGEIILTIGSSREPFGVINVGDDAKLLKECAEKGFPTEECNFSESVFLKINENDSPINLLIGSKKFSEGWNSWRVSTMGLMNVGKSEGAQIIQMFGRGVRLRGYEQKLKRSSELKRRSECGYIGTIPENINVLETLSVFGIDANYMKQFRDILQESGISVKDNETLFLPVIKNIPTEKLKVIRLKEVINGVSTNGGNAFRKLAPVPTLDVPEEKSFLLKQKVCLNLYPKVATLSTLDKSSSETISLYESNINSRCIPYMNLNRIYFKLEQYKAERGWANFNLSRSAIKSLLSRHDWYKLLIPEEEMNLTAFSRLQKWEDIAIELLKKYMEKFYYYCKNKWEQPYLEYVELDANDPNFLYNKEYNDYGYTLTVEKTDTKIIEDIKQLAKDIKNKNKQIKDWTLPELVFPQLEKHLYVPLLYKAKGKNTSILNISPVQLNEGEKTFVEDLKIYYDRELKKENGFFANRKFYLLRNQARGRGIGFFEEGGFYPDYIMWLLEGNKQYITFIDPKGISLYYQHNDKIEFYKRIKDIERQLGDKNIILNSIIVSVTPRNEVSTNLSADELDEKNVFFQKDDKETYIEAIFRRIIP